MGGLDRGRGMPIGVPDTIDTRGKLARYDQVREEHAGEDSGDAPPNHGGEV